jgi:N-acetylglucosamine kinase-like BadF-type ATPase
MRVFLGVDVGNSKSLAVLADENGRILGIGRAGNGSWEGLGWDGAREVLHDIFDRAIKHAGISKETIAGAGFGYAGYDWPEDRPGHIDMIASLGLRAPYVLGNDALLGLVGGAKNGWGIVVAAGTSVNCLGRDRNGCEGRIAGFGFRFGENAGAAEIMSKATQAVNFAWSKRGPETALSQAFLEQTGARDIPDFLAGISRGRYKLPHVTAKFVFELAEKGDLVSQNIITWAGQELGDLAIGVARQLNLTGEPFQVILAGSLFEGGSRLIDPMRKTILAVAPQANFVRLEAPAVIGGVLLGMEEAGLDTSSCRDRLLQSAASIV